jgi:hypothetical protein
VRAEMYVIVMKLFLNSSALQKISLLKTQKMLVLLIGTGRHGKTLGTFSHILFEKNMKIRLVSSFSLQLLHHFKLQ